VTAVWLLIAALAAAQHVHDARPTGPAAGQRPGAGPADSCGRVTELDWFLEKRPECDDALPRPAPLGQPFDVKAAGARSDGLLPELRAVVPVDLTPCRKGGRDLLWFSAGIANVGDGPLQIRPGNRTSKRPADASWIEKDDLTDLREAVQWILNEDGEVAQKAVVGVFGWHAVHNHYHTDAMALYEVRRGPPDGPVVNKGRKISFCLDDSYAHEAPGVRASARAYEEYCRFPQGIGPGWVDEYPYAVAGQYVDVTDAKEGDYTLVVTVDPDRVVRQKTRGPDSAWARFTLRRLADGGLQARPTGEHSACEGPGLCGEIEPDVRGAHYFRGMSAPRNFEERLGLLKRLGFCD